MWSEAEFRTKARAYFQRAEAATGDDQLIALLCSLGLEFLLRAPLAAANPLLLADPAADDGYSALHAAGFPGTREPLTVKTKAVVSRLGVVVEGFEAVQKDVQFLVGLRNRELHTSASIFDDIGTDVWLPKFLRAITVLARHFNEEPADYLSKPFLEHASNLVDVEDQKIKHEVATRLNKSREFVAKLTENERGERIARVNQKIFQDTWERRTDCPACGSSVYITGVPVRYEKEVFDGDDTITQRVFLVNHKFACPVCGLELDSTAEIAAAGIEQGWSVLTQESLEERYLPDYAMEYENE
jgi:hypothetical protein